MALDPTVIALIGTVMGGVGLKIAEHWLGRNQVKVDHAARLRDELRLEITAQREEIKQLEILVNKWRDEYYATYEKYIKLQTELTLALHRIKVEAIDASTTVEVLAIEEPPVDPQSHP
jgi:NAD-dependent oxidoreductase involved in siderophore biosynthesis